MLDRHRTDFVELFFGLAFLAGGAGFIVHQTTDREFDTAWIAAIGLVTIGLAFLAVTLLHRPRDHRREDSGPRPDELSATDG
ncbi:MAG TPA: hypothetical protein VGP92_10050 [Acidimicrobiia bacterium]|jgi:hypothetical protein|nr:hypothetical protein [Acidimicrobiia bacterium]